MDDEKELAAAAEQAEQPITTETTISEQQPESTAIVDQSKSDEKEELKADQAEAPTSYEKAAETVDQWFNQHIHNSPASQYTEVYNHLSKAKDSLKEMLKEVFSDGTV